MDKEIKDIINLYQYDRKTRTYSNKHYFNDNSVYSSINSNHDVTRTEEYAKNIIRYFENFEYDLVPNDIIEIEKAIARYEEAIHKVLACYDNPKCNFKYSADELMQLINNWELFDRKLKEINMRLLCQD